MIEGGGDGQCGMALGIPRIDICPVASSSCTISIRFQMTAIIKGVSPSELTPFTSTPPSIKVFTTLILRLPPTLQFAANAIASAKLGLEAPPAMRAFTVSACPVTAASNNAVLFECPKELEQAIPRDDPLTAAPLPSREMTFFVSPLLAARTKGVAVAHCKEALDALH